MFIILAIIGLINKKPFFNKDFTVTIRKNIVPLIIYICFALIEVFGWLYILKGNDMSKMIPLNSVYISLFSAILGVIVLNEKMSYKHVFGILFAIISIFLLHS
jgi:uncharacterized membrane protein